MASERQGLRSFEEDQLRQSFETTIANQLDRLSRSKLHPIIPNQFFSAASTECRDMFVSGHYYGCISLCQSVAEGLARFVAERNQMRPPGEFEVNVATLRKRKIIPEEVADSFLEIHGKDRNDFHHLNKGIEQDCRALEQRAEECLRQLYLVESYFFGHEFDEGRIRPTLPKYWDLGSDGRLPVFVRFGA